MHRGKGLFSLSSSPFLSAARTGKGKPFVSCTIFLHHHEGREERPHLLLYIIIIIMNMQATMPNSLPPFPGVAVAAAATAAAVQKATPQAFQQAQQPGVVSFLDPPPEAEATHQQTPAQRMEAALDELDNDVKREYIAALEIAPHLVSTESEASKFLRCEGGDPIKAAKRLALYWKYRKVVFGDRWLLPMIQTGTGALTAEAIDLLRRGFIAVCSPPGAAVPVVLIDASRRTGPTADGTVAAIAFYLCTTVADAPYQSPGVTLLHLIADGGHWNPSPIPTRYWSVVHTALPMRIRRILMVPKPHVPGKQHLLEYLSFQTSRLVQARSQRHSEIVAANSLGGTAQLLHQMAGICASDLPHTLGGTLDTGTHVAQWIRARITVEDALSAASPILNQIHATRGSSVAILRHHKNNHKRKRGQQQAAKITNGDGIIVNGNNDTNHNPSKKNNNGTPQFQTEQERKDYIRQRNALYSRRKYHKHKLDLITLPDRCKALQQHNAALKVEQARLTV